MWYRDFKSSVGMIFFKISSKNLVRVGCVVYFSVSRLEN